MQPFFNNLKLNNMKQKNLETLTDEQLININWYLEFILDINESTNILSRSEISIIHNWQKQIKKVI